jgi:integrase
MENVRVIDVLSFLQELVDEKRARSTIRVYHAALSHYFVLYNREDLLKHPIVKLHFKGAQNLAPVPTPKWVIWDPEIPLHFLSKQPLPTKLRPAGQEALLLLLLATGIRVSDANRLGKTLNIVQDVCAIPYLEKRKTGVHLLNWFVVMNLLVCALFVRYNIIYVWLVQFGKLLRKNFCLFPRKGSGHRSILYESG